MDPIAGSRRVEKGVGISEKQASFIAERGGIMTIYWAASVIG